VTTQLALPMPSPTEDVLCAGCCAPVDECTCIESDLPVAPSVRGTTCGGCGLHMAECRCHYRLRARHGPWAAWEGWYVDHFEHPALNDVRQAVVWHRRGSEIEGVSEACG